MESRSYPFARKGIIIENNQVLRIMRRPTMMMEETSRKNNDHRSVGSDPDEISIVEASNIIVIGELMIIPEYEWMKMVESCYRVA
jgi:hypothetical protein